MTSDNETNPSPANSSGIFVVRLGSGEGAQYAVCHRISTVDGGHRLPGAGQTVAELVDAQALSAAAITDEDSGSLQRLASVSQSGNDDLNA